MTVKKQKTIGIDFDGVIHRYSKGWQNGEIYDEPVENAIESLNALLKAGYRVFIFSARQPRQIKRWLKTYSNQLMYMSPADFHDQFYPMQKEDERMIKAEYETNRLQYKLSIVPFWKKFWNKTGVLGITRKKLVADIYIDDRAITFTGSWYMAMYNIGQFKTYQEQNHN